MKNVLFILKLSMLAAAITSCAKEQRAEKGFSLATENPEENAEQPTGLSHDSLRMATMPGHFLLTGLPSCRITPEFLVNTNKKGETYVGSVGYREKYHDLEYGPDNAWHYHVVPGYDAVYGFNMINAAVHDLGTKSKRALFEKPVLIRTLYFPSYMPDTLRGKPVMRGDIFVSAYDEDTNKDQRIGLKDLRRLFRYMPDGTPAGMVLPADCSVTGSEYDPANDLMIIYARHDQNANGTIDNEDPGRTYVLDLQNPQNSGRVY